MSSLNVLQGNIAKLNIIPNVLKILRFTCNANGIRTLSIDVITFVARLLFGKYCVLHERYTVCLSRISRHYFSVYITSFNILPRYACAVVRP